MTYSINKEKKVKNVLYEPLMDYIIKKNYNYIWEDKQVKAITKTIVTKAVGRFRSMDYNFTKEDLFTDCYMCLVKAVNTYSPFNKKGFMPFLLYYYSTAKYLIDKPKSVSTLFAGKREIVTRNVEENTNVRTDREVCFESGNIMDIINSEDNTFESIYDKELLDALNTLPKNIKALIVMTINGESQKDIGKVLGISQPMVSHYLTVLKNFLKAKDIEKALLKMQEYTMFTKQELKQTADLFDKFNIRDKVCKVDVEVEEIKKEKKEEKKNKYKDYREINIYKGKGNVFVCTANNITEAAKITNGNKYSIYKVLTGCLHSSNNYVYRYADVDYYAPTKKEELIIKVEEVENMENDLNIQQQIDKLEKEKEVIQKKIDGLTNLKLLQEQIEMLQLQIQEQMEQLSDIN